MVINLQMSSSCWTVNSHVRRMECTDIEAMVVWHCCAKTVGFYHSERDHNLLCSQKGLSNATKKLVLLCTGSVL